MHGRWVVLGSISVTLALAGCGGKDKDKTPPRTQPEQQCDALIDHWCTHALDCAVQGGLVAQSDESSQHDLCISAAGGACDGALLVTSGYDDCMSAIDADDCTTINTSIQNDDVMLPSVCLGVIEK